MIMVDVIFADFLLCSKIRFLQKTANICLIHHLRCYLGLSWTWNSISAFYNGLFSCSAFLQRLSLCGKTLKSVWKKNLKIVDKNTTKANACITAQHTMDLMFFRGSFTNLILHGRGETKITSLVFFVITAFRKKIFALNQRDFESNSA